MLDNIHNYWLLAAGVAAGLTTLIHIFGIGPEVVRPLFAAQDIEEVPKLLNYYCWHLVTTTIAAMTFTFTYAALTPDEAMLAIMSTVISGVFALWSILLIAWKRQKAIEMPQWILFAAITGLALPGLF